MRRLRTRMHSPRRVDQRPSASGLASHYGPRVDGHREQNKAVARWHSRLSWSASLFELAMSASGHSRPSWPKPLGHALPLRPESGRNDSSSSGRFGSENRIYPEQIMSTFSCRFLSKARSTMGALVPPQARRGACQAPDDEGVHVLIQPFCSRSHIAYS